MPYLTSTKTKAYEASSSAGKAPTFAQVPTCRSTQTDHRRNRRSGTRFWCRPEPCCRLDHRKRPYRVFDSCTSLWASLRIDDSSYHFPLCWCDRFASSHRSRDPFCDRTTSPRNHPSLGTLRADMGLFQRLDWCNRTRLCRGHWIDQAIAKRNDR